MAEINPKADTFNTYQFQCERGHVLEKLFSAPMVPNRIVCDFIMGEFLESNLTQKRCGLLAEKIQDPCLLSGLK